MVLEVRVNFVDRLAKERRGRLAAERLLAQKQRELFAANAQLARHAQSLTAQIREQRDGLESARHEAEALRGQRSQALSELERATTAAQIAERRLWEALETIRDGFALFDEKQRLIAANGVYLSMIGAGEELPRGLGYADVIASLAERALPEADPETRRDWQSRMIARIDGEEIEPEVLDLADGRHFRLMDRRGAFGDLVSLARDITQAVAREGELREARERAEAASRAKSAFLANMSHEIRTPMNGVVGMAELLCETELTEDQRLCAETIRTSGEALLTIINDLLDYSKIEAEKLKLYPEPFDLERCLHEVMLILQHTAQDKGVALLADYDMFLPTRFVGDRGRVRQILTNLLGNAVKFTARGHVLARVVGIEREEAFELHISVEDTGIGIAAENLEAIFGEFNQVDSQSNRQFEGTGLGLAITRQLVDMMGGQIWVDSELGHGSCFGFQVMLPAAEPGLAPSRDRRPILLKRALVIADVQIDRTILQRQLQTFGIEVTACRRMEDAVETLDATDVDLILAEPAEASAAGDLVRAIRARDGTVPVAFVLPDDAELHEGPGLYRLTRPVLRNALFDLIEALSYPDLALPAPVEEAPPPVAAPRRMRVLAAEDNRTNQLVFRKMVEDLDIDLVFAVNGREAVDLWQSFRPDLIFMDISMPGMDGCEAAGAIRAAEAAQDRRGVAIVALTAHARDSDSDAVMAAGLDRFLTKPLKKAEILSAVDAFAPEGVLPPRGAEGQPSARI